MRLFTWSFQQTVPIVVSRILRVHGSSGHELNSKNLQNKQGTSNGVPVDSLMLKLVKEVRSVPPVNSPAYIFTHLFLSVISLFYEEGSSSTFYGKWVIGSRNCREVGASSALQPFFLLGNQVACVFRLKDRFIILRVVSCEIYGRISFQVARRQSRTHWPVIFSKVAVGRTRT